MSASRIVLRLPGGNFAGVRIYGLTSRLAVHVRDGGFSAACGLRQPVAVAVPRQDVDMVGQPVEKRAGKLAPRGKPRFSSRALYVAVARPSCS
jgi:hypothetical protein